MLTRLLFIDYRTVYLCQRGCEDQREVSDDYRHMSDTGMGSVRYLSQAVLPHVREGSYNGSEDPPLRTVRLSKMGDVANGFVIRRHDLSKWRNEQ